MRGILCEGRGGALINKHSLCLVYLALVTLRALINKLSLCLVYLALVTLGLQFWACSKLFFNIFPLKH